MERMPRKQSGDECAAPQRAGRAAQKNKQQQRVGDVKEQVDEMVPARVDPEKCAVSLM